MIFSSPSINWGGGENSSTPANLVDYDDYDDEK